MWRDVIIDEESEIFKTSIQFHKTYNNNDILLIIPIYKSKVITIRQGQFDQWFRNGLWQKAIYFRPKGIYNPLFL